MLLMQCVLLFLAWRTGSGFDFDIFAAPAVTARDAVTALAALAACFVLRSLARSIHSEEERRRLMVYSLAPRTPREKALRTATVLVASVAEEAAYRGVGMSILWYALGNPWPAALVSALAFALAHWTQGWKSGIVIFCIALVFHGLVAVTGTLVLAMGVHAIYDFVAGYLIAREARRFDTQDAGGVADGAAVGRN